MGFLSRFFGSGPAVAEVDVQTVAAIQANADVQIVDCRTEREWKSGHLMGSQLMPLGSIADRTSELNRESPIIVVCRSGHRSSMAARQLANAGFTDVKSMKGGISAWSRAGNKLVS